MEDWIDVSTPLHNGMAHWPDDPPFKTWHVHDIAHGADNNLSAASLSLHTGTHMDAPVHFVEGGLSIDQMPLAISTGEARVIRIEDQESIKPEELERAGIRKGERVLFRTRNSETCWKTSDFCEDFVYISLEGAQWLADAGVILAGVDYLSVGGFHKHGAETHRILLGGGVWIIEGLQLAHVEPGTYEMICLPLRIAGADGAPARAVLRRL